jgi:hypothetical protein
VIGREIGVAFYFSDDAVFYVYQHAAAAMAAPAVAFYYLFHDDILSLYVFKDLPCQNLPCKKTAGMLYAL